MNDPEYCICHHEISDHEDLVDLTATPIRITQPCALCECDDYQPDEINGPYR